MVAVRTGKTTINTCLLGFICILITFVLLKVQDDYLDIECGDDYFHLQYKDVFVLWVWDFTGIHQHY